MLNRTLAPPVHQIESGPAISAEQISLKNVLQAHVLRDYLQPVLRLDIVFPAGRRYEPTDGLAHLASKMFLEGTVNKNAAQIAETISFYGASLTCQATADWCTVSLHCLSKHFSPLLELIKELIGDSTFPREEFDQQKVRTAQNIRVERKKNSYLANEALTQNLYGSHHPYRSGIAPERIEQAHLADLKAFFQKHYQPAGAFVFVCGAVEDHHLELLNHLPQGKEEIITEKRVPISTSVGKHNLSSSNQLQSAIKMGLVSPAPTEQAYFGTVVLNEVLGGYFGSRLMKNIREDKGFTYGIHSHVAPRNLATTWLISTEVNSDNAEETYEEICKEFKQLREKEIDAHELETVKSSLLGKFLNERANIFDQLDWYKFLVLNNLPATFFDTYLSSVKATTAEELRAAAGAFLNEHHWTTVIVGK